MIRHQRAKALADAHLGGCGSGLVAGTALRSARWDVWLVSYVEPNRPRVTLDGGELVVTDDGDVHDVSSPRLRGRHGPREAGRARTRPEPRELSRTIKFKL